MANIDIGPVPDVLPAIRTELAGLVRYFRVADNTPVSIRPFQIRKGCCLGKGV
jgi:hypothetical protein